MLDRLALYWRCEKCGMDQLGPVGDLPDVGIPICGECGDDMALQQCAALKTGSDHYLLLVPARGIPHRLVVKVQRGLVTEVQGIPDGILVEVRDYDAPQDGESSHRTIENDEDGAYVAEEYIESAEAEKGESRDRKRRRRKNL